MKTRADLPLSLIISPGRYWILGNTRTVLRMAPFRSTAIYLIESLYTELEVDYCMGLPSSPYMSETMVLPQLEEIILFP